MNLERRMDPEGKDALEGDGGGKHGSGPRSAEESSQHRTQKSRESHEEGDHNSGHHRNRANHSKPNDKTSKHFDSSKSSSRGISHESSPTITSAQSAFVPPSSSEYNHYPYSSNKTSNGRCPPVGIAVAQQRADREAKMQVPPSLPLQPSKPSTQKQPLPPTTLSQRSQQHSPVTVPAVQATQHQSRPSSRISNRGTVSSLIFISNSCNIYCYDCVTIAFFNAHLLSPLSSRLR